MKGQKLEVVFKSRKKNAKSRKKKEKKKSKGAHIQIHVEKKAHNFFIRYPNSKKKDSLESLPEEISKNSDGI